MDNFENSARNAQSGKKFRGSLLSKVGSFLAVTIIVLFVGGQLIVLNFFDITTSNNAVHIHLYSMFALGSVLSGGYEVHLSDIESIELLPYTSRQLSYMIDGLRVPNRPGGVSQRDVFNGTIGNYRLFIDIGGFERPPTIYITRYEGNSIVISTDNTRHTNSIYEQLMTAWGR